jgi:hypothetical protein
MSGTTTDTPSVPEVLRSEAVGLIPGLIHVRPPPSGRVRTAALMLVKVVVNNAGRPVAHLESERGARAVRQIRGNGLKTAAKPQFRRYMCAPL